MTSSGFIRKLRLRYHADINSALGSASSRGFTDTVQLLLDKGADVNTKDSDEETALFKASKFGNPDIVQILIDAGADVNAQNKIKSTALIVASARGYLPPL